MDTKSQCIIGEDDLVLVTGAGGFIGSRVVAALLELGFRRIRCLLRSSSGKGRDLPFTKGPVGTGLEIVSGNLLSREDCEKAVKDVAVVFHLAAARGEKSFPDALLNSVVTTRNLLEACAHQPHFTRFVNVSSFAVYTNTDAHHGLLDESCTTEKFPHQRGDAYTFAKARQEEIVAEYGRTHRLPYVILRPGYVYGPGNPSLSGRVGVDTFGIYLHFGGSNRIPLSYVDNCADAIVLAGLVRGIEGEIFNVVDDNLVSSRELLRQYKRNVKKMKSVYCPHFMSYALCWLWEKYSSWSEAQIPPVFNRKRWHAEWKKTQYTNAKLKRLLGWTQRVSTSEGLRRYFQSCREGAVRA
jgi:nucleoside-diphosphate-sugar epimerase